MQSQQYKSEIQQNLQHGIPYTIKRKWHHFDDIFVTDRTSSCHADNFKCSQRRTFRQNDDISVSVHNIYADTPFQFRIHFVR